MVAYKVKELRETLLDQQRFAELARFFAKKTTCEHSLEADDHSFSQYLEAGLDLLLEENLKFVFEHTESPIETIFVNSLILDFIKNNPLNLVVQHSVRNAPKQIEAFRDRRKQFKKFMSWYETKYGSMAGVDEYLDKQLANGNMERGEHHYLRRHYVFYEIFSLENCFHMILQPGLPDIRVEDRTVRPDMLFWIPSNESVRIIVECDGFQFHKGKDVFVRDRKRDRALKTHGYEVLRFSGSEIYNDPIAASSELAEYLLSIDQASETQY